MNLRSFFAAIFIVLALYLPAGEIRPTGMRLLTNDMSGQLGTPVLDRQGRRTALVKVKLRKPGAIFDGMVKAVDMTGDYYVWMEDGNYMLLMRFPGCEPKMLNFKELMGKPVEAPFTYELTIDEALIDPAPVSAEGEVMRMPRTDIIGYISLSNLSESMNIESNKKFKHGLGLNVKYADNSADYYVNLSDGPFELGGALLSGGRLEYTLPHVAPGDSIMITSASGEYQSITKPITLADYANKEIAIPIRVAELPIKGVLKDELTGEPLAGINVELSIGSRGSAAYEKIATTMTDAEGRYEFPPQPATTQYHLTFDADCRFKHYSILLKPSKEIFTHSVGRFVAQSAIKLGKVHPEDVTVLNSDGSRLNVKPDGRFDFPLLETRPTIVVSCPGHKTLEIEFDDRGIQFYLHRFNPDFYKPIKLRKGDPSERERYRFVPYKNFKLVK